jgi:Mg2+ and Co2+ transporter CorA
MRVLAFRGEQVSELPALPEALPAGGFLWVGVAREVFEERLGEIQGQLHKLTGGALVDLHVSDLLNRQLPSHFDYTSWYDLVVFRRLVAASEPAGQDAAGAPPRVTEVDTSAVGFAIFDRVLVTVHHAGCSVREHFAQRLLSMGGVPEARAVSRLPASPADLMLRMVNHMVDNYLDLRRQLTRQLGRLQQLLLDPRSRFNDWHLLLESRTSLNLLEDICEDQRSAIQEWIDALDEWPAEADPASRRERELLRVRSRDVLEHVERVLGHVRRLEESAEAAVQMHFSALGHRTNEIMRTLTVLTAIFLPLNLITGFFGMNFDSLPLIHSASGLWVAFAIMVVIGIGLVALFRRKRYLDAD